MPANVNKFAVAGRAIAVLGMCTSILSVETYYCTQKISALKT
jgi:hypothetical protein